MCKVTGSMRVRHERRVSGWAYSLRSWPSSPSVSNDKELIYRQVYSVWHLPLWVRGVVVVSWEQGAQLEHAN